MNSDRRRIGTYFVALLFAVASVMIIRECINSLLLDYRYAGVMYFGETISAGGEDKNTDVERYAKSAMTVVKSGICRSDILKAGLAIVLKRLEISDSSRDYDNWFTAVDDANQFVEHAIECIPTNGDLWLRMAMVAQETAEDPLRLGQLISQSRRLAPAEISEFAARLNFYNHLGATSLSTASETINADLLYGLKYEPKLVRDILQKPSSALLPYLHTAIAETGFGCKVIWEACGSVRH